MKKRYSDNIQIISYIYYTNILYIIQILTRNLYRFPKNFGKELKASKVMMGQPNTNSSLK
jgi:hypothetical protein